MKFKGIKKGRDYLHETKYKVILELTGTVTTDTRPAQDEACQYTVKDGGGTHEASPWPGELLVMDC